MAELKIKSNGLRNELKEIRKSIDALTQAIIMAQSNKHQGFKPHTGTGNPYDSPYTVTMEYLTKSDAQTHKRYENNNNSTCCNDSKLCKCKNKKTS